ncbi:hypothetical protein C1645_770312 [Glomus cerebriforme]|uniref:Uncharacterized protein n=1 Tax=Glomus cerebriforme TaxID=658196 RepID=A0A397T1Y7_9GLOM|nr:hypothetical protein C1645_770312 [Glomus cerebriforme]
MKIPSTFLSIAFIAFILISLVTAKQPVDDEKLVKSFGECAISSIVTGVMFSNSISTIGAHTLFCVTFELFTGEENEKFLLAVVKEILLSIFMEITQKLLGINLGKTREIVKKIAMRAFRVLKQL